MHPLEVRQACSRAEHSGGNKCHQSYEALGVSLIEGSVPIICSPFSLDITQSQVYNGDLWRHVKEASHCGNS